MQSYSQSANEGKGPDAVFGLTHDNIGSFYNEGQLTTVPSGLIKPSDYISDALFDACSIDGKNVAVPIAQESIALYYNKDLVSSVPTTMEQLVEDAKTKGFQFDFTDFYLDYGFVAANGGYIFGGDNGKLNPKDIGLGNEGAIQGYKFLQSLVSNNLINTNITTDEAKENFINGKTAYYLSGPWDIATMENAGLNFGVIPIPTLNGNTVTPLLGVQIAFVSSKSDKQDLAWDLIAYLCEHSGEILLEKGNRLPVKNSVLSSSIYNSNKHLQGFIEQSKVGVPMPNIPEVQIMWQYAQKTILPMLNGTITPEQAGETIKNSILKDVNK